MLNLQPLEPSLVIPKRIEFKDQLALHSFAVLGGEKPQFDSLAALNAFEDMPINPAIGGLAANKAIPW